MMEFLWKFEHSVTGLQRPLQLALAVAVIAAGLFVWLGGLGFRKVLFTIIGVCCGIACTLLLSSANILLAVTFIGICAILALKIQELFLTLVVCVLATVYGFAFLIRPYVSTSDELFATIRQVVNGVPYYNWPILLALAAAPAVAVSALGRITSAILCSAAGAALLFAGFICVLLQTGLAPVAYISSRRELHLELFLAVTALGAIIQLLLVPRLAARLAAAKQGVVTKVKRGKKSKSDDAQAQDARKTATWRTA